MRRYAAIIAAALLSINAVAHTTNEKTAPNDTIIDLRESTITSLRVSRRVMETPSSATISPSIDFKRLSALSVSNVLATEPGIAQGGDGVWSTNINVRGLSESRLITLVDGNRIETATDLTASLSMIDINDIARVEIIKGAQSSIYGTGAMGGIVNIITKDGSFSDKLRLGGEVSSSYASANNYFLNNISLNTSSKRWYLRASATYGKADNIKTPIGVLKNSHFNTSNISAKFGVKPFSGHLLKIQYQRNYSFNVGIPGGDSFPGPADAEYREIGRNLFDISYEVNDISDVFKSLKVNYFYQDNLRDVEVHPNTVTRAVLPNGNTQITTPDILAPNSHHKTNGACLQTSFQLSEHNTLVAGADFFTRNLTTSRTKHITVNVVNPSGDTLRTNKVERGETPIPHSTSSTAGIYIQDEARLLENRLILNFGGRIDGITMKNEECFDVDYIITNGNRSEPPANRKKTFDNSSTFDLSWSANIGALYKLNQNSEIYLNGSRNFRAPSLEERFKYIDLGNYVRKGNPKLKPESGYSTDLGIRVGSKKVSLQASLFMNRLNNMIIEAPSGDTMLVNSNVGKALLYGGDIKAEYNVVAGLALSFTGSYTIGRDILSNTYLPLIPPINGRLGARYTFDNFGTVELSLIGAAKQDKIADGERATNGYTRLDFSIYTKQFRFTERFALQAFAGMDNITNTTYTNHLSTNRGSISCEPGRNIYFKINLCF